MFTYGATEAGLIEEEIQEAEAEEAASMLEIEDIIIEDNSEDADVPELDRIAVEDLISAGVKAFSSGKFCMFF